MRNLEKVSSAVLIKEIKRRGWAVTVEVQVEVKETIEYEAFCAFSAELLVECGIELKLSNTRIRVLEKLLKKSPVMVSKEILIAVMYQHRPDGGPITADKMLQQAICAIRKQISASQYHIEMIAGNYCLRKRARKQLGWTEPPQLDWRGSES